MDLAPFHLDRFLAQHEHSARAVLGTSGVTTAPAALVGGLAAPDLDYGVVPGDPRLVRAVAHARGVRPDEVLLTVGGTEAIFLVAFALVKPGARVLVETPTYPPLADVPRALGADVERFARSPDRGWRIDVDALAARLDRNVALVSLSNPNNPTGHVTHPADLVKLAKACDEVGAWLLVDDIFRAVVQPRVPVSRTLHPRIITAESMTKCHGVSGLRAGWVLAPPELVDRMRDVKGVTTLVNPAPAQQLTLEALRKEDALVARTQRIVHDNLARWRAFLPTHAGVRWREPECPLLSLARLPDEVDDVGFCQALLKEEGVLLVPGSYLGAPGSVRVGFGADPAVFQAGLEGLGRFLRSRGL